MFCNNCQHETTGNPLRHNPREATKRLWCPTWITASKGPIDLCDEHAMVFMPEHNLNANRGSWHLGDEADKTFKFCEAFFAANDERCPNIKGMLANGSKVGNTNIVIVDGKAWLICQGVGQPRESYIRLGNHVEAKELFPVLFSDSQPIDNDND